MLASYIRASAKASQKLAQVHRTNAGTDRQL